MKDANNISNYILKNNIKVSNEKIISSILLVEDRDFFHHKGVCFRALLRAFIKSYGGASTINMQLVRTITDRRELTIKRKIRECILSLIIDHRFKKREIIDAYLACAYFGVNIYGVNQLSLEFFNGMDINNISLNDAFFMASLLKRPYPGVVSLDWAYKVNTRMNYIRKLYASHVNKNEKTNDNMQRNK